MMSSVREEIVRLGYDGLTVEVVSDRPEVVAWLTEFLTPSFDAVAHVDAEPRWRIRFVIDAAVVDSTVNAASGGADEDAFTLDGDFSRHRTWHDEEGLRWARDEHGICYRIDDRRRDVLVLVSSDGRRERAALMRVVRELATASALARDRLPLHAAAFEHHGATTLVCGPKRAGKTSLLLHALGCGGRFVANDRVFVDVGPPPLVRGMPTIVSLRAGSLALFGEIQAAYLAARYQYGLTIAECEERADRGVPTPTPGRDYAGISPVQFCRLAGTGLETGGPLRGILLPRVDAAAAGLTFSQLAPAEARAAVQHNLLRPSNPIRSSGLFGVDRGRFELPLEREEALCARLAEQIPVYSCVLGAGAYDRPFPSELFG